MAPEQWAIVTISVEPAAGRITTFIDGKRCQVSEGLSSASLRLQHKLVVFGGGKQAETKGGDVRRIIIHGTGAC